MNHHLKGVSLENTMHYILKLECPVIIQIIAIIGLFWTVFFQNFSKVFWKGSWLAYINIKYTTIWKKCSDHKVLYKFPLTVTTFFLVSILSWKTECAWLDLFLVCERLHYSRTSMVGHRGHKIIK